MVLVWANSKFDVLGEVVGVPADQAKLIFCFLASVGLGLFQWRFVHGTTLRHIYSIIFGLSLAILQFGFDGLVNFGFSSAVVYVMLAVIPRGRVGLPVFVFSLAFLSYVHIYRMMTDWIGWTMDASGLQMMLTSKMSSLAFCYQDGVTIKKSPERVPAEQKRLIVDVLPNLLEYYSYLCFYPGFLVGPTYEFMEYITFVKEAMEFENIPSPLKQTFVTLAKAFAFMGITLFGGIHFPHFYCGSKEFYNHPLWYRVFYFNAAMFVCKARYTTGWKFTEAGINACGFGYTGKDKVGNEVWTRSISINWDIAEYGWTAKEMVDNWNVTTTIWIRRYIYNRIVYSVPNASAQRKSAAQHMSYLLSGFWHGFYPSYYIMFFWFSIHSEISKMTYIANWDFLPFKRVFKLIAWSFMWQIGNCLGIIFCLLDPYLTFSFLHAIYYWPLIVLSVAWLFFKVTGLHRNTRKSKTN